MRAKRRFLVEDSKSDEVGRIRRFLAKLDSENVVNHDEIVHRRAADTGQMFHVIDEESDEIVSCAMATPVGDTRFIEIGNCAVASSARGFRIQQKLIRIRAAAIVIAEGPQSTLVSGVDSEKNEVSLHNLKQAGFAVLQDDVPELLEPCKGCRKRTILPPSQKCCCTFYKADANVQRALVREFLTYGTEILQSNQRGEEAVITLTCRNAVDSTRRQILEGFVSGAYAE